MLTASSLIGSVQALQILDRPTSRIWVTHAAQICLHRRLMIFTYQYGSAYAGKRKVC